MKKRVIIIPAAILAIATPATIVTAKHLDRSSTAPIIKSNAENWSKTATVTVATAATFGGSGLDHYEYCINDVDNTDNCDWKISTVETVRVRNLGTSYVWLRAVSEYGVVSDISNYVLTRVDRNKPTATSENTVTTSSITVTVTATDDSDIKSYEYSINDSAYVADGASHTFTDLTAGTQYAIKVKVTDLAGNTKILSLTETTNSPVIARTSRSAGSIKQASAPGGNSRTKRSNGTQAAKPEPSKAEKIEKPEAPETPEEDNQEEVIPDEQEEAEAPKTQDCFVEQEVAENQDEEDQTDNPEQADDISLPVCREPEEPEESIEQGETDSMQPQEPENDETASTEEEIIDTEPDNNDDTNAIENSEAIDTEDTILDDPNPQENTSAIDL